MKLLRLVAFVLAAAAWTASAAFACNMTKGASASAANAKGSCGMHATTTAAAASACPASAACPMGSAQCTAAMQAKCTPAMRAACAKGGKTTAASAASCGHGTAATTASMEGCTGKGTAASAAGCSEHASRTAAAKGAACCAGAAGAATAAGSRCDMKGMAHSDCSVCTDEATCANDLRAAGVRAQVVPLRNGAMIVYTADNAENVRALQTTVARYNEHIMTALTPGSDATLCGECKAFRGAMASSKFTRELVNVKNGCQILLTSSDRSLVRKIHDMTGAQMAARVRI